MIVSMLTLNIIAFQHVGWFKGLMHGVPADYWQLFRPAGDAKYPWPALVFGYPVCGIAFWCADQTIVQRKIARPKGLERSLAELSNDPNAAARSGGLAVD